MKVVLRSDVADVGTAGEIVDVAAGFARNHLIPRGLALRATRGTQAQANQMARARATRDNRAKSEAQRVADELVGKGITIAARAGAGASLYGSVTAAEIATAIQSRTGIEVDRRKLEIAGPIRKVGSHEVEARLHPEVQFSFTVDVVALP